MAGHSKWAKVKHFKGAIDAKRGRIFSKLSREIAVAAKLGGGDPELNPRLRMALLRSRAASMPKDNIERAIKKSIGGGDGANFEELTYEIYAPGGVAILAEITTDNRNRTAAEIRSLVTKAGGSLAAQGAVSRLFRERGQLIIARSAMDEDLLLDTVLKAGAEDLRTDEHGYAVLTDPAQFESVHTVIESKGVRCESAEITAIPDLTVRLTDPATVEAVTTLVEALDDHDDVQQVYSNAEFPPDPV